MRSLCTLHVTDLTATFRHDGYSGKYEARLSFLGLPPGSASTPCTDLKWRALGRRLLDEHPNVEEAGGAEDGVRVLTLTGPELWAALGGSDPRRCWLALGTTRAFDGRRWPLVIGVQTVPDCRQWARKLPVFSRGMKGPRPCRVRTRRAA